MGARTISALCAAAASLLAAGAAAAGADPSGPQISAAAYPATLQIGAGATISGTASELGAPLAGTEVQLQIDPYPYRGFRAIADASTAASGAYSFAPLPLSRNTRLRVVDPASPQASSAPVQVIVQPAPRVSSRSLGPGRVLLTLRLAHAPEPSPPVAVRWYAAARGSRLFRLLAITASSELPGAVTAASAVIDPPARRFIFRVCLRPAWEASMGPASSHGPCPRADYEAGADAG